MASLKPGVLTKLLDDMNVEENGSDDVRKPVLLQIRSIIPVMEKDDLWPTRGFYLKVSDLSHATDVSLPHEQDEMILSNKLQLGQFIYVQKLEASHPVPVLKGVMPVPGRHSCDGIPEDIAPVNNLVRFLEASDMDSVKDKGVISEKKMLSDSESLLDKSSDGGERRNSGNFHPLSASKAQPSEKRSSGFLGGVRNESSFIDNDSDSDSPKSSVSTSTRISKRRSWTGRELLDVKEILVSSVAKKEIRPRPRSHSACVSPARSTRYDSSDDNATSTIRRQVTGSSTKLVKNPNRSKTTPQKVNCVEASYPEAMCSGVIDRKGAECGISWESLPSNLVKHGKDMIRHRDGALIAAVEALQEACAAEKLIKCLSTYSEFESSKGDNPQPLIDNFFTLQDNLAQTRLIVQSLTNISPLRTPDSDLTSTGSVKEVLNLAVERKKNATSWIKTAIAFDLSPFSPKTTTDGSSTVNKSSKTSRFTKPKVACMVRKQRTNGEIVVGLKDNPMEWIRGNTLCGAAELACTLQDESRRSFMVYVEKLLDEVENKVSSMDSHSQVAGMMYQIKKVNDWLDIINKEANFENNCSEIEACGRIRNKIYEVLLKNVERSAMAFKN